MDIANEIFYMEGGLGDTLQHLPFMMLNKDQKPRYFIINHYKGAKEMLRSIGIKVEFAHYYRNDEEKIKALESTGFTKKMHALPRSKYFFENPFPKQKPLFTDDKPVIGIHLCGSKFSTDGYIKNGAITKTIPADIIFALSHYNLIVFGLPEEITRLKIKPSNSIKFISYLDPAKSLSYVEQCDAVVAADSSIKTMSSMLKIPTFVWVPDQVDWFRDTVFINPYVSDGVMKVYKYKDAVAEFKTAMDQTHDFLREML